MHGKTSPIIHDGKTIFAGLAESVRRDALSFAAGRRGIDSPTVSRSARARRKAKSWDCAITRSTSRACSSIPNRSARREGKDLLRNFLARVERVINLREAFERGAQAGARSMRCEAESVMGEILDDVAPDALVAGFLVALKDEGRVAAELSRRCRARCAGARASAQSQSVAMCSIPPAPAATAPALSTSRPAPR